MASTLKPLSYSNVLICGWGITGKATEYVLGSQDHVDLGDKAVLTEYDFLVLCLPTPTIKGKQDISAIEEWLKETIKQKANPIIIIRSTILPGTTDKLSKLYNLQIAHVPEFLTEATALEDALNPQLLVIGSRDILIREKVKQLFLNGRCHPKKTIMTDPTTAEMIKYTMNSFFALKVTFANQLWDVAKSVGANYSKLEESLKTHKWGSKNGWDVWHGGYRGFGGRCLIKDTEAFVHAFDLALLEKMIEINNKLLKEK